DVMFIFFSFFFSSRRRHTRFSRDWSSDVCSSDLKGLVVNQAPSLHQLRDSDGRRNQRPSPLMTSPARTALAVFLRRSSLREIRRSEERRVGKECRARWCTDRRR